MSNVLVVSKSQRCSLTLPLSSSVPPAPLFSVNQLVVKPALLKDAHFAERSNKHLNRVYFDYMCVWVIFLFVAINIIILCNILCHQLPLPPVPHPASSSPSLSSFHTPNRSVVVTGFGDDAELSVWSSVWWGIMTNSLSIHPAYISIIRQTLSHVILRSFLLFLPRHRVFIFHIRVVCLGVCIEFLPFVSYTYVDSRLRLMSRAYHPIIICHCWRKHMCYCYASCPTTKAGANRTKKRGHIVLE